MSKTSKCSLCNYTSNRLFNIKRHYNNKHNIKYQAEETEYPKEENIENEYIGEENIENEYIEEENVENEKMSCAKCGKVYLTINYLKSHEEKCIGLDILTCNKCMFRFTSRTSKYRHVKNNNCKAKSIIHIDNVQNRETKKIIINNYGNERLDYLTFQEMLYVYKSNEITLPLYIEKKHFNKEFPENNNIIYDDKTKLCKVKIDNEWKYDTVENISNKLIQDNSDQLFNYFKKNKELFITDVTDIYIYYEMIKNMMEINIKKKKKTHNSLLKIISFFVKTFKPNIDLNIYT